MEKSHCQADLNNRVLIFSLKCGAVFQLSSFFLPNKNILNPVVNANLICPSISFVSQF
jgi:hypothetical protein